MYKFTKFLKISHSNLLSKPISMKMGYRKNCTSYYCTCIRIYNLFQNSKFFIATKWLKRIWKHHLRLKWRCLFIKNVILCNIQYDGLIYYLCCDWMKLWSEMWLDEVVCNLSCDWMKLFLIWAVIGWFRMVKILVIESSRISSTHPSYGV